eukprot:5260967-Pyramimonas_sp.AAC.1
MTNEFSWWRCVTHMVVIVMAVATSYYVFVVKEQRCVNLRTGLRATQFQSVRDDAVCGSDSQDPRFGYVTSPGPGGR